jgi:GrpB-like predicted nucleotidyltransferase (UPF0157 family)
MAKELSEMSLEELWELFPIFLVEHNDSWNLLYEEMKTTLQSILSDYPVKINHIGSTAIPGIWAKNIVDILIEIPKNSNIEAVAKAVEKNGFIRMSTEERRISFNHGYTKNGFADKVYHIHLRYAGDNDELYFRDYLLEHPNVAKDYESLKLRLSKQFEHHRDAYTNAKTAFIRKWTNVAKVEYFGRY